MAYPVEKPATKSLGSKQLASTGDVSLQEYRPVAVQRDAGGHWLPGASANPGGRIKPQKPITEILRGYISTPEGRKAILKAARSQVRVSEYQPAMATYVRETLEGKLTERVEIAGGLELAARIRRARQRLAEADNDAEEHTSENE
jgi:hypothetical protein